jgi:hypothetical protein
MGRRPGSDDSPEVAVANLWRTRRSLFETTASPVIRRKDREFRHLYQGVRRENHHIRGMAQG